MKKIINMFLIMAGISLVAVSCNKEPKQQPVQISIQLLCDGAPFSTEGVTVTLTDAAGAATYEEKSDASGIASFAVPVGAYTASALYKEVLNGERIAYNGSNTNVVVVKGVTEPFTITLNRVVSQQVIIKEFYCSGCPTDDNAASYQADQYMILYNNSADPADASNIVVTMSAPYNAASGNPYYGEASEEEGAESAVESTLLYENLDWMPAGSAIWWFTAPVTIEPYSQIVVVFKKAIDHTQTVTASVDLSKPEYYWMNPEGNTMFAMGTTYQAAETISSDHHLQCKAFAIAPGGWPLDVSSPTVYIGKMDKEQAKFLSEDSANYDPTLGGGMLSVVKFPKANFVDAIEIWPAGNEENCHHRFSSDVNTGHLTLTPKLGYSAYRNVDKEATEALPENEGKLVYNYAGGTGSVEEDNLSTDPSGIDAEASIANGAHIIYSETNNTSLDFHQRATASLRK